MALGLGATAILILAGAWNIALQREQMTELVRASADRGAGVILLSMRAAMLDNRPDEAQRILDNLGAQRGIELIRIFDKQGRVQKSTRTAEIDQTVDMDAEQCWGCHKAGRPLERLEGIDRMRIFRNDEGRRVLSVVVPIRNAPDCSTAACHAHPPQKSVLGVLDFHMSLDTVDEHIESSEVRMALGFAAAGVAVLLLGGLLTWFFVLRPVSRFRAATQRVAAGDLTARVPVETSDEFGQLAGSWNAMVTELARARTELERWSRTLEVRVEEATKELEATHQRMLLVEKMASLGKLAAVVAHEINNPLAGIATYAKLLRKQIGKRGVGGEPAPADAEMAKALDLVEGEAVRCGGIVRNLLAFSRTPGSRVSVEDVAPLLERCATLVRHQAELQEVAIRLEVAPGTPRVECDPSQVQQFVLALAMNAIEAMPRGGTLSIRAAPDPRGGAAIQVADTGVGIAQQDLPHIFEPFFTTKEQGKGVGLGLAVVYGIVQRHHAEIEVDTKPGAGTTFTVRLPLVQPPPPAADAEPRPPAQGVQP